MTEFVLALLRTLNQLLTAGIAITAFSLLLHSLTFNLRDRVARAFAMILICVVVIFFGDAVSSIANTPTMLVYWLNLQWIGIIFLPFSYLYFSDALLATTGRPSRGRRRLLVRLTFFISLAFLIALMMRTLAGPLVDVLPAPYLQLTPLTWVFTLYYVISMVWALVNLLRAFFRSVTSTSRRRMFYLLAGASAPAMGSYPYLVLDPQFAASHPLFFWSAATLNNLLVSVLLVLMAYAVAFFGVPWPDRVVKRRLFKWLMRGPVTASMVLMLTTLVRRAGEQFNQPYSAFVPVVMVGTLLLMEYVITLAAPVWERWLFHGGDRDNISLLQALEERLLTSSDLRQFLESVLASMCDRLQAARAFIAVLGPEGAEMVVRVGDGFSEQDNLPDEVLTRVAEDQGEQKYFSWGEFWLLPLFERREEPPRLLGLVGVHHAPAVVFDEEQTEALDLLAARAALALEDRARQQQVFMSLETLTPQVEIIQRLRAASRYDGAMVLTMPDVPLEESDLSRWVKDALTHYWGGPRLTESPLIRLQIVQKALDAHEGNPANALRSILRQAIDQVRPEGERRFTAEWILFNILEMKFMEGHKVREIALRLAMSEADLYRKQRVAIEAVARAVVEMEQKARQEEGD